MPLSEERMSMIREAVKQILTAVGEDVTTGHFAKTPDRVAKLYSEVLDGNFSPDLTPKLTHFDKNEYQGMVVVYNVPFYSFCAHHMLPFMGHFTIGCVPANGRLLGLSKYVRIVREHCKRFTTQEEITRMAVQTLMRCPAKPLGAACYLDAEHTCMSLRGVQARGAKTATFAKAGEFEANPHLMQEFLAEARKAHA